MATLERAHWFNNHRLHRPTVDVASAEFEYLQRLEQATNDAIRPKKSDLQ